MMENWLRKIFSVIIFVLFAGIPCQAKLEKDFLQWNSLIREYPGYPISFMGQLNTLTSLNIRILDLEITHALINSSYKEDAWIGGIITQQMEFALFSLDLAFCTGFGPAIVGESGFLKTPVPSISFTQGTIFKMQILAR
jgi:hypothetical protein